VNPAPYRRALRVLGALLAADVRADELEQCDPFDLDVDPDTEAIGCCLCGRTLRAASGCEYDDLPEGDGFCRKRAEKYASEVHGHVEESGPWTST